MTEHGPAARQFFAGRGASYDVVGSCEASFSFSAAERHTVDLHKDNWKVAVAPATPWAAPPT
eukprot:4386218-Pyramimonas_sp.AAC.1